MTDFKDMTKVDFSEQMREAVDRGDSAEVNRLIVGYLPAVKEMHKEEVAELKEWLKDREEWAAVEYADTTEGTEPIDDRFEPVGHMDVIYDNYEQDMMEIDQEAMDASFTWGEEVVRLKDHPEIKLDEETCDSIIENANSLDPGREIDGKDHKEFAYELTGTLGPEKNLAQEYAAKLKAQEESQAKEEAARYAKYQEEFGF